MNIKLAFFQQTHTLALFAIYSASVVSAFICSSCLKISLASACLPSFWLDDFFGFPSFTFLFGFQEAFDENRRLQEEIQKARSSQKATRKLRENGEGRRSGIETKPEPPVQKKKKRK